MLSGCVQVFSRMISECSDGSCGPGGIWWSFQMKVWTLKIQRNSMIPNYSMIPAIWWSPAIRWSIGSIDFDNPKSTVIPPSLMVLFCHEIFILVPSSFQRAEQYIQVLFGETFVQESRHMMRMRIMPLGWDYADLLKQTDWWNWSWTIKTWIFKPHWLSELHFHDSLLNQKMGENWNSYHFHWWISPFPWETRCGKEPFLEKSLL